MPLQRELAHQVVDHLNKIAKFTPLSQHGIVSITGGFLFKNKKGLCLMDRVSCGNPWKILRTTTKGYGIVQRLSCTDIVVLDEADRLLQMVILMNL